MKTKVINLFGGPGVGKSTVAAGLYAEMKEQGFNVELVREHVKNWAWQGVKPTKKDQPYLLGRQIRSESILYDKVDYIITDSPILLFGLYPLFYDKTSYTIEFIRSYIEDLSVQQINFNLSRSKNYKTEGRYETLEEAKRIDKFCLEYLASNRIEHSHIIGTEKEKIYTILEIIKKQYQ